MGLLLKIIPFREVSDWRQLLFAPADRECVVDGDKKCIFVYDRTAREQLEGV